MPDKLVLLEIYYQPYVVGLGVGMMRKRKFSCPKILLQVGSYMVENLKQAVVETKIFGVYQFGELSFFRHDSKGMLKKFCK